MASKLINVKKVKATSSETVEKLNIESSEDERTLYKNGQRGKLETHNQEERTDVKTI